MATKTRKAPGKARKHVAANRGVTTSHLAKAARDGQDQASAQQATIDRLRASKQRCGQADNDCGFALGKRWAEKSAEASELRLLEQLHDELEAEPQLGWDGYFEQQDNAAYGTDEELFFALHPAEDKDRRAAKEFWEGVAGDALQQAAFPGSLLKGFAEGCLEVWMLVKEEL